MRYLTLLGVLVLGLAVLFSFVSVGVDNILMVAIGALLVGIGSLTGQ